MITFKRYLNRNVYYLFLIIYAVSLPLKSNEDFYEIYKYLHQNPELSLQEFETTKYLEDLLEEYVYLEKSGRVYLILEPLNRPTLAEKIAANIQVRRNNIIKRCE